MHQLTSIHYKICRNNHQTTHFKNTKKKFACTKTLTHHLQNHTLTLMYFKHSFITNETLDFNTNHIYINFTYTYTNDHIFITKYTEITIKQHTSKTTTKIRIHITLIHYLIHQTISNKTQNSTKYRFAHTQMV